MDGRIAIIVVDLQVFVNILRVKKSLPWGPLDINPFDGAKPLG